MKLTDTVTVTRRGPSIAAVLSYESFCSRGKEKFLRPRRIKEPKSVLSFPSADLKKTRDRVSFTVPYPNVNQALSEKESLKEMRPPSAFS